ncbi:MAG: HNH endonuclease [Prochlorococcaceae cyanobacterium]
MHARDGVFLEDLCPKFRVRRWRQSLHNFTEQSCIYCGCTSESIDHVLPRSRGGLSVTENCVPACLACNGHKSDADAFEWYRQQRFYDPRRAMAIRAWMDGDLRLALRLLQWVRPGVTPTGTSEPQRKHEPMVQAADGSGWSLQAA